MHTSEEVLTSNTARLVAKALPNHEIRIRGRLNQRLSTTGLVQEGKRSLLLFPSSHAVELSATFVARLTEPVTLVVPDGSWVGTRKFVRRDPVFADMTHVKLPPGLPSQYRLRAQADPQSLCTLEAVARAIGLLESRDAQTRLEALLCVMVERTLWSRGAIKAEHCTSGLPLTALKTSR